MSNRAFRGKQQSEPLSGKAIVMTILVCGLLVIAAVVFLAKWDPSMRHTTGHILQTRVSIVGLGSGTSGKQIYYRGEAQVAYEADGRDYVEWLPATKATLDRGWLDLELLSRADDGVDVVWQSDPRTASAVLHYR